MFWILQFLLNEIYVIKCQRSKENESDDITPNNSAFIIRFRIIKPEKSE